jgi:aryl-alcohol dehydrogenase-like predicted oxidoreductase
MEDLFKVTDGERCATNQVSYSLSDRGIEPDLLPRCEEHSVPVMAYSPLGGDSGALVRDPTLARIGTARDCSAARLRWPGRSAGDDAVYALSLMNEPHDSKTLWKQTALGYSASPPNNRAAVSIDTIWTVFARVPARDVDGKK